MQQKIFTRLGYEITIPDFALPIMKVSLSSIMFIYAMLIMQQIIQNPDGVKKALLKKRFSELHKIDELLELHAQRRKIKTQLDDTLARLNQLTKEIGGLYAQGRKEEADKHKADTLLLKETCKQLEHQFDVYEEKIRSILVGIPNTPHASVPEGDSPADNHLVRMSNKHVQLIAQAKPHWELLDQYDIADMSLGAKLTGTGFPLFKGKGAKLQRALVAFFLDQALAAGYSEVIPPFLVNEETAFGTGQLPDKEGQMYFIESDKFYLIPTAEVPVTNIFRDIILNEEDLPVKLVAYSPCFRREAGSYGKDVRGLNRVHQFDKVEIVQIQHPDKSYDTLEEMVAYVEGLLQKLELPYRIMKLCGGDMGFAAALTYDFEVYSAAQQRWLEVSSVSNFETFQSNRMKLRFRNKDKKNHLAHTLNGSALALPRVMAALLENNQQEAAINIPAVLHSYTGFTHITKNKP